MAKAVVKQKIEYRKINDTALTFDLYYPPGYDKKKKLPLVVFNNGVGGMGVPDWRGYSDWCRLVAANGMIGLVHQARNGNALNDGAVLLEFLRSHSGELNIDENRIAMWTSSANSPAGIRLAMDPQRDYIKALVVYYGGPDSIRPLRQDLPTLVVRAGLDAQFINGALDNLVQAALSQDMKIELINYLEGIHAFDVYTHTKEASDVILRTVEFLKTHLLDDTKHPSFVLTNRNFMWLINNGQISKALTEFRKTREKNRADSTFQPFYNAVIREDVLNANGYLLIQNNKRQEALQVFQLMVESYPNSSNAYDGLADAYEALGNKAEAIKNAEICLQKIETDNSVNAAFKVRIKESAEEKLKRLKQ